LIATHGWKKFVRHWKSFDDESGGRAERVQQLFSIEYDAAWEKPKQRF
jgi:hypothetical protein